MCFMAFLVFSCVVLALYRCRVVDRGVSFGKLLFLLSWRQGQESLVLYCFLSQLTYNVLASVLVHCLRYESVVHKLRFFMRHLIL